MSHSPFFHFRNEVIVMNTQIIAIANQKGGVGYEK